MSETKLVQVRARPGETNKDAINRAALEVPDATHVLLVEAWGGALQPWRVEVWTADYRYCGCTGGCRSPERAVGAARRIVAKYADADARGR